MEVCPSHTCRSRWLRQVARATVPLVPFAVLMFVIVGPGWITWAALLGGSVMALIHPAPPSECDENATAYWIRNNSADTSRRIAMSREIGQ
jgi:hypothetical protein